jgi:uncharacterized protein (TIGR02391 family)
MWVRPVPNWDIKRKHQELQEVLWAVREIPIVFDEIVALDDHTPREQWVAAEDHLRQTLDRLFHERTGRPRPSWATNARIGVPPEQDDRVPMRHRYRPRAHIDLLEYGAGLLIEQRLLSEAIAKDEIAALQLHPLIAEASAKLYIGGHYRSAVLDASLALAQYVREKSGCDDKDGVDLMRHVFSKNNPILAFNDLSTDSHRSAQEGVMHSFVGAVQWLRNPRAHGLENDDPETARDHLQQISLLAKRLDQARRV